MAAGNWTCYSIALSNTFKGLIDWSSANVRAVLLTTTYTPGPDTHSVFSDVSGFQVSGTGYTAGGTAVTGHTVTASTNTVTATGTIAAWANSTITARYVVLVLSTGGQTVGASDKILAYGDMTGGGSLSTTAGSFSVTGYTVTITHTP